VKIVCLVKQVPRADSIAFDEETKSLRREGVPLLLNPFDAAAVVHAAALRDHNGGEVIAMTMGPPQAEEALKSCLALGADRCIHLSDRVFAVADTIGTSRTLALAIEREGGVDLVVAGRKTTDSETWQVPPEVAAFLGWPHLTSVVDTQSENGTLRATRETDDGFETYELPLPGVISIAYARDGEVQPSDGRIDVWTASDLVDDVRENDKRFGQTGSPTRVLAVRDVTPPRAGESAATPDEARKRIEALLDERKLPPSEWEKPERLGERPGRSYDCWTLIELDDGRPTRHSLELLGKGRELAGKLGGENVALLVGSDLDSAAQEAGRFGAERVVLVDSGDLEDFHPERHAAAVRAVVEARRPHVLLVPSTANGRDVGPRVAGDLTLGMTGDCVGLGIDRAGRLIQTKPAYGGNIVSVIMGATTPQLATVRARMFEPLEPRDAAPAIERFDHDVSDPGVTLLTRDPAPARDLDEADVVVCLGPELEPDEVAEARAVAERMGAAVGGTREVCERGDIPQNRQIGLYGRPVAPELLVTVGVPGDFEQATGFVKAHVIAAVRREPSEQLRPLADVSIAGDWRDVLPALL
jgi:electron transfer flavoprotein alpha/beta subunit